MSVCPSCGASDCFDTCHTTGGTFCIACGFVLEESTIRSEVEFGGNDSNAKPFGQIVSLHEEGGGIMYRRGMSRESSYAITSEHRQHHARNQIRSNLEQLCVALRISGRYVDDIWHMVDRVARGKYTQKKWVMDLAAVCLYIVARQNGLPLTLLDVAEVTNTTIYKLGRNYKQTVQLLKVKVSAIDPVQLVERTADSMNTYLGAKRKDITHQASRLARVAHLEWLDTGRLPSAVAGAALKLAAESHTIKLDWETLASHTGAGKASIRNRYNELKAMLVKIASPLPWAKDITVKNLATHLPFLLNFVESLRALHRTPPPQSATTDEQQTAATFKSESGDSASTAAANSVPVPSVPGVKPNIKGIETIDVEDKKAIESLSGPPAFVQGQLERAVRRSKIKRATERIKRSIASSLNLKLLTLPLMVPSSSGQGSGNTTPLTPTTTFKAPETTDESVSPLAVVFPQRKKTTTAMSASPSITSPISVASSATPISITATPKSTPLTMHTPISVASAAAAPITVGNTPAQLPIKLEHGLDTPLGDKQSTDDDDVLDAEDLEIERLILAGADPVALEQGYFHAPSSTRDMSPLFSSTFSAHSGVGSLASRTYGSISASSTISTTIAKTLPLRRQRSETDVSTNDEELTEADLPDEDLHLFIRSSEEVQILEMLTQKTGDMEERPARPQSDRAPKRRKTAAASTSSVEPTASYSRFAGKGETVLVSEETAAETTPFDPVAEDRKSIFAQWGDTDATADDYDDDL